jgi:tetratricopeptide (TPR) repeat protein
MLSKSSFYFLFIIAISFLSACRPKPEVVVNHLGEIKFEATGKAEAQPVFMKGMLLLHSFEYVDASEAFQEVMKIDSDFVMAYWGEAMTHNHPLWQEQDYDIGNEILNRLAPTPEERIAKAKTDLEKDFIGGVNILYGPGNKSTRDSLYAEHMKSLYVKYPGNDEVASFYSLSLNGWGSTTLDKETFKQAASIAYEVLERNPNHPGALHYVIHAYDDPQFAALALETADKYALVAPDAGHALHMPTHTYLALGLWDKVVSSNIVSWKAEQARKERKKLDNNALAYHAYHWLQFGQLQLGEKEKAKAMVDTMLQYCTELPSPRARVHLILLKTTYLAETNDYQSKIVDIQVDQKDLNIVARAKNYFVNGMAAYYANNKEALDSNILTLANERVIEDLKTSGTGIRMCGNVNRALPTRTDLLEAETMEMELRAMRAWLDKDATATENFFKKATALHDEADYAYGPSSIVKPSYELYGEWLLENGRPKEALAQFEKSLKLAPNKRLSVMGRDAAKKLM